MLTVAYIEALLADAALTDAIWELWDRGLIDDWRVVWLRLEVVINSESPAADNLGWEPKQRISTNEVDR